MPKSGLNRPFWAPDPPGPPLGGSRAPPGGGATPPPRGAPRFRAPKMAPGAPRGPPGDPPGAL